LAPKVRQLLREGGVCRLGLLVGFGLLRFGLRLALLPGFELRFELFLVEVAAIDRGLLADFDGLRLGSGAELCQLLIAFADLGPELLDQPGVIAT
jgi:hypothetical protein